MVAISADNEIEYGPGFRHSQRFILDDRRLSERLDFPQAPWRKHGFRVALISDDFVIERELLQEPQDPL